MKKSLKSMFSIVIGCLLLGLLITACKNDLQESSAEESLSLANARTTTETFADLIAYKNSPHQLMMGYYRTWGDAVTDPQNYKTKMTDLPDSLDIVSIFSDYTPADNPFWSTLKTTYIPYLHARGTKVIITGGYFGGASTNPTGLANWVQGIMANINEYNYDGYDIDIESTATGTALQDQIACFTALSAHLGPLSGTGKLLIYDTNQNGNALMAAIKDKINYVFLQAYWRSVTSLSGTFNTYAPYITPNKFLVGVSFEDGTGYAANQMPAYSQWQPTQGTKGGVFAYGIDMEGPNSGRNYITTRTAIQTMNPANGTAIPGISLYQNCSYGGWKATLSPGNYTLAQMAAKGAINDDASSIKIPAGYTVTLYEHDNFTGASLVLTSDNSCLISNSFNDKVSSLKVVKN